MAFPTETVYGLGVHALDRAAVRRLFEAKGRPSSDPLIVHVASLDAARDLLAEVPAAAYALAERFWPGPLTLVMRRSSAVPDEVTAGLGTVAIRVPAHPVARALIEAAAIPVAAPSANLFSRPSPTRASHVLDDLDGRIDLIVDGGPTQVGVESTVLDLSRPTATILRPGAVTLGMLRDVLPGVVERQPSQAADNEAQPSPGLLSKHYAPRTPLTVYRGTPAAAKAHLISDAAGLAKTGSRLVLIACSEELAEILAVLGPSAPRAISLGSSTDLTSVSQRLYAALREADAAGANDILMVDALAGDGFADAIRDRITRAATTIHRV